MQRLKSPMVTQSLQALRLTAPFAMAALCLWALSTRIELPSLGELGALLAEIKTWQWLAAFGATAISFWALGRYDSVAHRHLQTGLDSPQARKAGMAAIAFSQFVGFGLFTGAYARWRLVPGLTALQAAHLTGLVALTFLIALAAICGLLLMAFPPVGGGALIGGCLVLTAFCLALFSFLTPELHWGRVSFRFPSLTALAALSLWALVDVAAAGTALWLLLPQAVDIALLPLLTIYCVALGAAILSSAPGGTGPLELAVFSLLPTQGSADLLAALLAFRLVYYALPAGLACLMMVAPRRVNDLRAPLPELALMGTRRWRPETISQDRTCAETGVIRQNGGHIQDFGFNRIAMLDSPQLSLALFDPLNGDMAEVLPALRAHARQRNTTACVYKCAARNALAARQAGWAVLRIAADAIITPDRFCEKGSQYRQLRRKLRHAQKAGLEIRAAAQTLPLSQMEALDLAWQDHHGPARGTTMGRFEANYLASQRVFLAWQKDRIIGFVTFHTSCEEWALDLIRLCPDAPDGTGHSLIRHAIEAAKDADIARLSLAAVPDHRFASRMAPGLRRFKGCFAPRWEPRYIACPTWAQMGVATAELVRLIHRPGPVIAAACPDQLRPESDSHWTIEVTASDARAS